MQSPSATFPPTPTLLKQILEVAKDDSITTVEVCRKPEAITPINGNNSTRRQIFCRCSSCYERVLIRSLPHHLTEFQYMADAKGLAEGDSGFVEGFADSANVLALRSKITNNTQRI